MKRTLSILVLICVTASASAQEGHPGAHFVQNWDLDGDGAVTVAEAIERRGYVFLSFDEDENGYLDAGEYAVFDEARARDMENQGGYGKAAMQSAAAGMTMDANDTDGDGRVSAAEFTGNAAAWIAGMDRDGDGQVTTADFAIARGRMMGTSRG